MVTVNFATGRVTKNGDAPVMMWVSVGGKRKVTQLPIKVEPTQFRKLLYSNKVNDVQTICNKFKTMAVEFGNKCVIAGEQVTAQDIINHCTGKAVKSIYTIENMVNDFLKVLGMRAENEITEKSYYRYVRVKNLFFEVIDVNTPVSEITNNDIVTFKQYLMKKYKFEQSTLMNCLKRMKTIFGWGVTNGKITLNPFMDIKTSCKAKEVTPLTSDELSAIEQLEVVNIGLERVRDMFLFSCYTGLSYVDLSTLTKKDIQDNGNVKYIKRNRQKTDVQYIIPLSPKAMNLLEKYDYNMPVISNQKTNQYLKTIGDCAGVSQILHFHLARHTALTMMLENGIPLEVVSKIAGHTNIKQTQHYAKIVENRVLQFAGLM